MKSRQALLLVVALAAGLNLTGFLLGRGGAGAGERPNILWLVSEDNDTFLGCYGDPLARTPTLDQLAREGVLYERCFAQPVCAPSRFTLITGMYAVTCGPAEHMRAQGKIPSWLKGFPAYLREAGYYTSNNAKTDYNSPINIKEAWDECGGKAHWRNRPEPQQPFFSVFNHEVTHESCLFPEQELPLDFPPIDPAKVRIPPYQPDTPEIRADWARYYNHLTLMDDQIAAKLKELEEDGLADNTIVFYYSDNGGVLPRSKRFLQKSGTHVPLIIYFPPKWRHLAPGRARLAHQGPGELRGFRADRAVAGRGEDSRLHAGPRLCRPGQGRPNEFVFCTRDRMDERYDMMRSVMDSRWLYIRNYRPDLPYVQPLDYMFQARGYQSWARVAAAGQTHAGHRAVLGREADRGTLRHGGRSRQRAQPGRRSGAPRDAGADARGAAAAHARDQGQRLPARRLGAGRLRRLAPARRVSPRAGLRAGQPGLRAQCGESAD